MINDSLKILVKSIFGLLILVVVASCNEQKNTQLVNEEAPSDDTSEAEVKQVIEDLYAVYTKSDLSWVDFYKDEYTLASDDGTVKLKYADSLRTEWEDIYSKYEVILNSRGEPILSASGDQVFHYNSFDEIFIEKATNDTIENIGTWIVLWKRQKDNTWKIEFETYHAK